MLSQRDVLLYAEQVTLHPQLSVADIRIVQAMADFQMALSATDFLCELDENAPISRVERRRYRCYEDAAVIAYWRPFSKSNGLPTLSFSSLHIKPTPAQRGLHDRLRVHRNQVIAHTDIDRMRLSLSTVKILDKVLLPQFDFDDGLIFFSERWELMKWLRTLSRATAEVILERVQDKPAIRFIRDHLDLNRA